jgi:hypothetical protein
MGNSKNPNMTFRLPINYRKRETRKVQLSCVIGAARPATGRFKNLIDHLVEFIYKSFRCPRAAFPIPARRGLSLFKRLDADRNPTPSFNS